MRLTAHISDPKAMKRATPFIGTTNLRARHGPLHRLSRGDGLVRPIRKWLVPKSSAVFSEAETALTGRSRLRPHPP